MTNASVIETIYKMVSLIIWVTAIFFFRWVGSQECFMISVAELGDTRAPSRDGLLAETYVDGAYSTPPLLQILEVQTVCRASALTRDKYRFVSVVVRQTCDGARDQCEKESGEKYLVQYDLQCRGDPPKWSTAVLGTTRNVRKANPFADLDTKERRDCGACTVLLPRRDIVTHCIREFINGA